MLAQFTGLKIDFKCGKAHCLLGADLGSHRVCDLKWSESSTEPRMRNGITGGHDAYEHMIKRIT
jgi:hypothetical protein